MAPLVIDVPRHEVYVNKKRIFPTLKEFGLLVAIRDADGVVLTRQHLAKAIWKKKIDNRTIDQHVARLRKKIGKDRIETVAGIGYKWSR